MIEDKEFREASDKIEVVRCYQQRILYRRAFFHGLLAASEQKTMKDIKEYVRDFREQMYEDEEIEEKLIFRTVQSLRKPAK
jgi:hemerythrin superfamily protein